MTINANNIVAINPGVIGTGGNPLSLNGLMLSQSLLLPMGAPLPFVSLTAVGNFFGTSSAEYAAAAIYFLGNDNSPAKPGTLYFAPFAVAARAAWLQSGNLSGMTLAQLQALGSGTLIITVDGVVKTSGSIALGAVASFTAAATAIAAAFTGTPVTCVWNAVLSVFIITSVTTGASSTIGYATGTLNAGLLLTAATGATLSQGAVIDTPATAMNAAKLGTQNWGLFGTLWEPITADKTLFAQWVNSQNQRFLYVVWDTDAQAIVANSTTNFGALAKVAGYNGVACVYNTVGLMAFVLGLVASIDFNRLNGRTDPAFKSQSGFVPTVGDETIANNLLANGYSYYGSYATANSTFNFFFDGNMPGLWKFIDSYVDQVYMNAQFQLALMSLLTNQRSIPYNEDGYSQIRAALGAPISQALNNGTIRTGVTLSASQIAQVNSAAGRDVAQILAQQGQYLQVLDPGAQVRGQRGSPIVNFWYTDGGSVHKITMASIAIL